VRKLFLKIYRSEVVVRVNLPTRLLKRYVRNNELTMRTFLRLHKIKKASIKEALYPELKLYSKLFKRLRSLE